MATRQASLQLPSPAIAEQLDRSVAEGIDLNSGRVQSSSDDAWQGLRDLGSELWLDTGDIDLAAEMWVDEFTALTTNNTLLNAEVQKGIYDDLVSEVAGVLSGVDQRTLVVEIAFFLNARHGLRLVQRFGTKVSVELHTDLAHDIERAVYYGKRIHAICPDYFVVKVPLTPAGLLVTRRLREDGVPVNFTLGFSARHNYLATKVAKPSYVNVFLGRLGSYLANNDLGDGAFAGERATLASQRVVTELAAGYSEPTKQIAASLRAGSQVVDVAGVDVMTMPPGVAQVARPSNGEWVSHLDTVYDVKLADSVDPKSVRVEVLWDVTEAEQRLAASLDEDVPTSAEALVDRAHKFGVPDLFPRLDTASLGHLAEDGKIPVHTRWASGVAGGQLAIDTLLNLAGLASFTADQAALDQRIERLLG